MWYLIDFRTFFHKKIDKYWHQDGVKLKCIQSFRLSYDYLVCGENQLCQFYRFYRNNEFILFQVRQVWQFTSKIYIPVKNHSNVPTVMKDFCPKNNWKNTTKTSTENREITNVNHVAKYLKTKV